jgi:DNA repair exonuclease SbcCD ATPase subunit
MKHVIFKKITIQNFLSVGEDPVVVEFTKGLHILTGRNLDKPDRQNAVGKSSVADGIYFAIFGDTLREIKKELIINNVTGGKTCVELEFEVNSPKGNNHFKVTRTLSPNKVYVYKDGVDKTRDSIANTTKYICEVLSASPAIFQNCVIMTVNNAVPFMAKNKIEKRKFIEDIFGMEVFSRMISALRQEYNDVRKDHDIQTSKLDELYNTAKMYDTQKELALKKKNEKKDLYEERRAANAKTLSDLIEEKNNTQINHDDTKSIELTIDKLEEKLVTCDLNLNSYVGEVSTKRANLTFLADTYKKIGTKEATCPVCLRPVDDHDKDLVEQEKHKIKNTSLGIKSEIESINQSIIELTATKDKIRKAIQIKNKQLNELGLKIQHITNIDQKISQVNDWQVELEKDLALLDNNNTEFDVLIESNTKRLEELEQSAKTIAKKLSQLDIVKFVVSEEGVKSYIVNKLLELLNSKLYYYLKRLDSNSVCSFDEYFEEQIVNEKNKICSYFNFSGAERKSIDLACLFTFSDIRRIQGGVSYNLAIYDELLDSSFDEKSCEIVTSILQERAENLNECCIIISHRKESVRAITGETIYLEKSNGITRRIEPPEL